ncbi:MAG: POTRA domain-containing protein [Thermoanaerobaculia bacterium]
MCAGRRASDAALVLVAVCALGGTPAAPLAAQEEAAAAPVVRSVELRSDLADAGELGDLVTVHAGDAFSETAVSRSLRNLNLSGRVGEVAAYRRDLADGVEVVFALWARTIVDEVRLEGTLGLPEATWRGAVAQGARVPLYEDRVFRSVYRLQDLYRARGYPEARVRVSVDEHPEAKSATVVLRVDAGPRATVGRVLFDGDIAPFTDEDLTARLRAPAGAAYEATTVRGDRYRLESWLVRQGYRTASVSAAEAEYRPDAHAFDLTFPVRLGPRFEFEVVGADREKLVKAARSFLGGDRYDEALAVGAVDDLVTWYQQKGHYEVEVERSETTEDGVRRVTFTIEEGPVFELSEVRFEWATRPSTARSCGPDAHQRQEDPGPRQRPPGGRLARGGRPQPALLLRPGGVRGHQGGSARDREARARQARGAHPRRGGEAAHRGRSAGDGGRVPRRRGAPRGSAAEGGRPLPPPAARGDPRGGAGAGTRTRATPSPRCRRPRAGTRTTRSSPCSSMFWRVRARWSTA